MCYACRQGALQPALHTAYDEAAATAEAKTHAWRGLAGPAWEGSGTHGLLIAGPSANDAMRSNGPCPGQPQAHAMRCAWKPTRRSNLFTGISAAARSAVCAFMCFDCPCDMVGPSCRHASWGSPRQHAFSGGGLSSSGPAVTSSRHTRAAAGWGCKLHCHSPS